MKFGIDIEMWQSNALIQLNDWMLLSVIIKQHYEFRIYVCQQVFDCE